MRSIAKLPSLLHASFESGLAKTVFLAVRIVSTIAGSICVAPSVLRSGGDNGGVSVERFGRKIRNADNSTIAIVENNIARTIVDFESLPSCECFLRAIVFSGIRTAWASMMPADSTVLLGGVCAKSFVSDRFAG